MSGRYAIACAWVLLRRLKRLLHLGTRGYGLALMSGWTDEQIRGPAIPWPNRKDFAR